MSIESMVKRGCHRYMRMYPELAEDIFQIGCLAALTRGGEEDGAMMLRIKGSVLNFLETRRHVVTKPHGTKDTVRVAYIDEATHEESWRTRNMEALLSKPIKTEEYYEKQLEEICDCFDATEEERIIIRMLAMGISKTDIAYLFDYSPRHVYYLISRIGKRCPCAKRLLKERLS